MEGTVESVEKKESQNGKLYMKVAVEQGGQLKTYNVFKGPELKPGDRISYDLVRNGQYVNVDNVQIIGHTEEKVRSVDPSAYNSNEKESYFQGKTRMDKEAQIRIGHSWSVNAAIEIVKLGPTAGKYASPEAAREAVLKEAQFLSEWLKDRTKLDLESQQ